MGTRRHFRKDDIEMHSDGYGRTRRPAVNVKVYTTLTRGWRDIEQWRAADGIDAGFTPAWLEEWAAREAGLVPDPDYGYGVGEIDDAVDRAVQPWWESACEWQFDAAENDTKHFFGESLKCYLEGRSGGWLVVDRFTEDDVDGWDAIMVSKWGRFAAACRALADEVPYQTLLGIYLNVFLAEQENAAAAVAESVA